MEPPHSLVLIRLLTDEIDRITAEKVAAEKVAVEKVAAEKVAAEKVAAKKDAAAIKHTSSLPQAHAKTIVGKWGAYIEESRLYADAIDAYENDVPGRLKNSHRSRAYRRFRSGEESYCSLPIVGPRVREIT